MLPAELASTLIKATLARPVRRFKTCMQNCSPIFDPSLRHPFVLPKWATRSGLLTTVPNSNESLTNLAERDHQSHFAESHRNDAFGGMDHTLATSRGRAAAATEQDVDISTRCFDTASTRCDYPAMCQPAHCASDRRQGVRSRRFR